MSAELVDRLREHRLFRELPAPSEKYPSSSIDAPWRRAHVAAVAAALGGAGSPVERAFVGLLDALDAYLDGNPSVRSDYFLGPEIGAIIDAAGTLLNGETGRLDAGTVDRALSRIAERAGWDRDLSEMIG